MEINSEIVGEYGVRPLYRMLGYFSIIGLLRVHSLLGDFTLALKVMENVELNQKVSRSLPLNKAYFTQFPSRPSRESQLVMSLHTTMSVSATLCCGDTPMLSAHSCRY